MKTPIWLVGYYTCSSFNVSMYAIWLFIIYFQNLSIPDIIGCMVSSSGLHEFKKEGGNHYKNVTVELDNLMWEFHT